jgi:hypothetical protein
MLYVQLPFKVFLPYDLKDHLFEITKLNEREVHVRKQNTNNEEERVRAREKDISIRGFVTNLR